MTAANKLRAHQAPNLPSIETAEKTYADTVLADADGRDATVESDVLANVLSVTGRSVEDLESDALKVKRARLLAPDANVKQAHDAIVTQEHRIQAEQEARRMAIARHDAQVREASEKRGRLCSAARQVRERHAELLALLTDLTTRKGIPAAKLPSLPPTSSKPAGVN